MGKISFIGCNFYDSTTRKLSTHLFTLLAFVLFAALGQLSFVGLEMGLEIIQVREGLVAMPTTDRQRSGQHRVGNFIRRRNNVENCILYAAGNFDLRTNFGGDSARNFCCGFGQNFRNYV
jgi:hypothetical protein